MKRRVEEELQIKIGQRERNQVPEYRGRIAVADKLSRRLFRLLSNYPFLLQTEVDGLCSNTEINYIRSLLVLTQQARFRRYYRRELGITSEYITRPVTTMRNVRFQIQGFAPKPEYATAKRVLLKQAFGSVTGLVLSTDYAGLILDYCQNPKVEQFNKQIPKANRLWAQKPIRSFGAAYNLWFGANDRAQLEVGLKSELEILSREFPLEVLNEHIREQEHLMDTNLEHLFYLLEEAGIDYDEEFFASSVEKY